MQIVVAIVAIGFFIALNFVKVKSSSGSMKLVIFGTRIITIIIATTCAYYFWNHQKNRGMTLFGSSIDPIETNTFIGEWGWTPEGSSPNSKIIIFRDNGEFSVIVNGREPRTGTWEFNEKTYDFFLNYTYKTEKYKIQGRVGKIIQFIKESNLFLGSNEEYSLINRDKNASFPESESSTTEETVLHIFIWFWFTALLFFIIVEISRLPYKLMNYKNTITNSGKVVLDKLNIISDSLKSLSFTVLFFSCILLAIVEQCK